MIHTVSGRLQLSDVLDPYGSYRVVACDELDNVLLCGLAIEHDICCQLVRGVCVY